LRLPSGAQAQLKSLYPYLAITVNQDGSQLLTISKHPISKAKHALRQELAKGVLLTEINLPGLGPTMCFNLHLAASTHQHISSQQEISTLRKFLSKLFPAFQKKKHPMIIAGDLNLCPKQDRDFGLLQQLQGSEKETRPPEFKGLTQINPILGNPVTWELSPDVVFAPEKSVTTSASNDKIGYCGPHQDQFSGKVVGKTSNEPDQANDPRVTTSGDHRAVLYRLKIN
jgi:hypothetical protein